MTDEESTGELREQIVEDLARWMFGFRYQLTTRDPELLDQHWAACDTKDLIRAEAEKFIAVPLAPLLAKLRAVEKLVAFYDRHEYTTLVVDDLRRALDAS